MMTNVFSHTIRQYGLSLYRHKLASVLGMIAALVFGIAAVFGSWVWDAYQNSSGGGALLEGMPFAILVALSLLCALICFIVCSALILKLPAMSASPRSKRPSRLANALSPLWNKHSILFSTLLVLILWIPYMIIFYPGVLTYDSIWALAQCAGSGSLPMFMGEDGLATFSSHKPIAHTLLLGAFFHLGELIGGQSVGMFLLALLQCSATAFSLALACSYLERLRVPYQIRIFALLFCCLFPFIPIYAMSFFNDAAFSWLYVLWFIAVLEIVRSGGEKLRSHGYVLGFAVLGIVMSCFKTPGVYLVVLTLVVLAFVYRKVALQLVVSALVTVGLMCALLPSAGYAALNVEKAQSNEALGVVFQTTAAYVAGHGEEVTEDEHAAIDRVLVFDRLANTYSLETVDRVKTVQRENVSADEWGDYASAWFQMGLKHPETYLFAAAIIPAPFFCPGYEFMYYDDAAPKDVSYYKAGVEFDHPRARDALARIYIESDATFTKVKYDLREAIDAFSAIPVLGWLAGLGLWATWLPILCLFAVALNNKKLLPAFVPVILSLLLLLISPWAMARYALPLVYCAPIFIGLLFASRKDIA